MSAELYIGLMTGTSVDGIDAAICRFDDDYFELIDARGFELNPGTRKQIKALLQPGDDEIEQLGRLDRQLASDYANAVTAILNRSGIDRSQIKAIGCHGQTVRHRPSRQSDEAPFTLQIGDPNTLAVLAQISVVADFRRKDIALGGEGAPLAPGFHAYLARDAVEPTAFLNIGGIANLTLLNQANGEIIGFDCGPGNALLDYWINKNLGETLDDRGCWARSGSIHQELLQTLISHPFFGIQAPKSTGKEEFSPQWLEHELSTITDSQTKIKAEDVQATLIELTSASISDSLKKFGKQSAIYLCGGGARNDFLIERLEQTLPASRFASTEELGVHSDWVEACAFAWLAHQRLHELPGNIPSVTGARREALLGGIWPP